MAAPAARHRSRSPFMAFAVRAMTGSASNLGSRRRRRMASYPSISGIITSMRTPWTSGFFASIASASRPVSATITFAPSSSNRFAMPSPNPDAAPVTMATLPFRRKSISPC